MDGTVDLLQPDDHGKYVPYDDSAGTTPLRVVRCKPDVPCAGLMGAGQSILRKVKDAMEMGLFVTYRGCPMIFSAPDSHWVPLGSTTGMRLLSLIVGAESATVNYHIAIMPFVPSIVSNAVPAEVPSRSVCMGSRRYNVKLVNGMLELTESTDVVNGTIDALPSGYTGLCVMPAGSDDIVHNVLPHDWRCKVSFRHFALFHSYLEYDTVRWSIGNALLEPLNTARVVILYGVGNNGKSTMLREIMTMMGPSMTTIDISKTLTGRRSSIPPDEVSALCSCRVAMCGDVDMQGSPLNIHCIKLMTGGDVLRGVVTNHTLTCTIMLGTNSLPHPNSEWTSVACMRRLTVVPMDVDVNTLGGREHPFPSSRAAHSLWLAGCIGLRLMYSHPPVSTRSLLMTLCGSSYNEVCEVVRSDGSPSDCDIIMANMIVRALILMDIDTMSTILGHYHKSCYRVLMGVRHIEWIAPR
jgi:hypothetical protein